MGVFMKRTSDEISSKSPFLIVFGACLLIVMLLLPFTMQNSAAAGSEDPSGAQKAFIEASDVLFHPRCMNCHPAGDAPTIRDDAQPHRFNVKRGPEGKGLGGLTCARCHKDQNQPNGPPGVTNWHMPSERMPMIFRGRTPGELCRQLKDPKQNGGKTGEQIIEHLDSDPLVRWGWTPGNGRTSPKMDARTFTAKMREWVEKGAACPE